MSINTRINILIYSIDLLLLLCRSPHSFFFHTVFNFFFFRFPPLAFFPYFFFFLMIRRPPSSPLFPSPTLFRSLSALTLGAICVLLLGSVATGADVFLAGAAKADLDPPLGIPMSGYGARKGVSQGVLDPVQARDRKSTRLNSSHSQISYAVFCLK